MGDVAYQFNGERYDPETGLYYFHARYYSATLGRFLSFDPLGTGSNRQTSPTNEGSSNLDTWRQAPDQAARLMGQQVAHSGRDLGTSSASMALSEVSEIGPPDATSDEADRYFLNVGHSESTWPNDTTGGLNLYAYSNNNPLNLVDPFGLSAQNLAPLQLAVTFSTGSHNLSRLGAEGVAAVNAYVLPIVGSPDFVWGSSFGFTLNGANYNVKTGINDVTGELNVGTIHENIP